MYRNMYKGIYLFNNLNNFLRKKNIFILNICFIIFFDIYVILFVLDSSYI